MQSVSSIREILARPLGIMVSDECQQHNVLIISIAWTNDEFSLLVEPFIDGVEIA